MGFIDDYGPESSADRLLQQVAVGDREAFDSIYEMFASRVLAVAKKVLVSDQQSEEVCQEVFLEIWTNAAKFPPVRGSAASWIMTMAHRRAVDRIRASQASRDRDMKVGIRDFADAYNHVAHEVEITVETERVKKALLRLTFLQRQAITLAYYGGYSYPEISALLDTPIGTVKTRLRDGMIRLRDELGVTSVSTEQPTVTTPQQTFPGNPDQM